MKKIRDKRIPFIYLLIVSISYMWANFHRQSMAVMAPFLEAELLLTPSQIGNLGSIVFYIYGLTQLPIGFLSIKFGSVKIIRFSLTCLVIGTFIFGRSNTYTELLIGRLIIGFAVSGFYVPSLNLIRKWFDVREFGFYMGLFLAIGNVGSLLSTTPYELMLSNFSVGNIYIGLTVFSIFLVIFSFLLKEEYLNKNKVDIELDDIEEEKLPLGFKKFYIMLSIYGLVYYGTRQAFISLWGTSYFTSVFNYDIRTASFLMMIISIGGIIYTPIAGRFADKKGRFNALIIQSILTSILWIICALLPTKTPLLIVGFFAFWIGALKISTSANAFSTLSDYTTDKTRPIFVALLNTTNFFGSAILMQGLGFLFDGVDIGRDIFTKILFTISILIFVTILMAKRAKDKMDKNLPNCYQNKSNFWYS